MHVQVVGTHAYPYNNELLPNSRCKPLRSRMFTIITSILIGFFYETSLQLAPQRRFLTCTIDSKSPPTIASCSSFTVFRLYPSLFLFILQTKPFPFYVSLLFHVSVVHTASAHPKQISSTSRSIIAHRICISKVYLTS
jgi:hypothetical protein